MRDEKEERKKQARSNKQTRQRNTAHTRQSLFLEKNELRRVGLEPTTHVYGIGKCRFIHNYYVIGCVCIIIIQTLLHYDTYVYIPLPDSSPSRGIYTV